MAGGQQINSAQGTLVQSASVALVGSAITSGIGTMVADAGNGHSITGSAATFAAGITTPAMFVPLRSRKVGGGTATAALTGQAITPFQGNLKAVNAPALVGQAITAGQGSIAGTQRTVAVFGSVAVAATGTLTFSSQAQPTWVGIVPEFDFQQGTSASFSFLPYTLSFNPVLHQFQLLTGTLPTGVTIDPTTGLVYNGVAPVASQNISVTIADVPTDFATRSAGAYFAENFSAYPDLTAWYNHWNRGALVGVWTPKNPSMGSTWTNAWELITDPTHVKSGKALRAYMGKNPTAPGGALDSQYAIFPLSGDPLNIAGSYHLKYYFQAVVWVDEYIDYLWYIPGGNASGGTLPGAKFFVNETWYSQSFGDPAECVIDAKSNYPGFITGYHTMGGGGSNPVSRLWERNQFTPDWGTNVAGQGGVDRGTTLDATAASYYRRYGPMNYNMPNPPNQASKLHLQGVPNVDAAIGGMPWNRGGFTVIEIENDAIAHRCRVWAAWYGNAPLLLYDSGVNGAWLNSLDDTGRTNPPASAGTGNGFSGIGLSNLVFTADEANNPGRPAAPFVDYVELIAHPNPINFPGGFRPPGT